MNWPDSQDYKILLMLALPGKIFLKAYFVISGFSDIAFFKKRVIPHRFFPLEHPAPDTVLWNFLKTGHEWVLEVNVFWNCTFRFSN